MPELSKIYEEFTPGSDGFCRAVETQCSGFDLDRAQIRAIANRAKTAKEFQSIWENEDWWKSSRKENRNA